MLDREKFGDDFFNLEFEKDGVFASVESVSDVYLPVSGKVVEINETISENPAIVNEDAYGEGWLIKVELSDPAEVDGLLSAAAYQSFLADEA